MPEVSARVPAVTDALFSVIEPESEVVPDFNVRVPALTVAFCSVFEPEGADRVTVPEVGSGLKVAPFTLSEVPAVRLLLPVNVVVYPVEVALPVTAIAPLEIMVSVLPAVRLESAIVTPVSPVTFSEPAAVTAVPLASFAMPPTP